MSQIETLGILDEIDAIVSDKLQVVSYKWLSRNFSVSSNVAKRLLQEFVEKHGSRLKVVYTLSGWLKSDPPIYHIRLVSGPNLSEARQEFDGICSVQVYSVQSCIPKDPAALWNTEFVQSEELFKQPPAVANCLRDNRFCGISNALVKRNTDGMPISIMVPRPETGGVPGTTKHNSTHQTISGPQPQQRKLHQSSPDGGRQSSNPTTDVKSGSNGAGVQCQAGKPFAEQEKAPASKKKGQNDITSAGIGGSLANLWGRASTKSEPGCSPAEANKLVQNTTASAEAQICARETVEDGSSGDDVQDVNFKRASNVEGGRKRRVVFDYSDDEDVYEDAVNLGSPDLPKGHSNTTPKQSARTVVPQKCNLNFDNQIESEPRVKEEKEAAKTSDQLLRKDSSDVSSSKNTEPSASEKIHKSAIDVNKKGKMTSEAPSSPKRRKVLKTRTDERGREVTEVVWEGEETKTEKDVGDTGKMADKNSVTSNANRPPVAKKSPAMGSTAPSNPGGKAGNKKAGVKDPKQGNILSFFKKV